MIEYCSSFLPSPTTLMHIDCYHFTVCPGQFLEHCHTLHGYTLLEVGVVIPMSITPLIGVISRVVGGFFFKFRWMFPCSHSSGMRAFQVTALPSELDSSCSLPVTSLSEFLQEQNLTELLMRASHAVIFLTCSCDNHSLDSKIERIIRFLS